MLREETGRENRVRVPGVKFKGLGHQARGQGWGTLDPSALLGPQGGHCNSVQLCPWARTKQRLPRGEGVPP